MPSSWFRIAYAENAFRRLIAVERRALEELRAPTALALMLTFYREHRAQHARIPEHGDGLLWRWGPSASGEHFAVDLIRQLVREGGEQPPVQLRLTLGYRWTPTRRGLGTGRLCCVDPAESADFARTLRASPAWRAISTASPTSVLLRSDVL